MTNQQYNNPPHSEKWEVEHFAIHLLHAEYIDSIADTGELLANMKQYDVKYDVAHFPGDAVSVRLHVLVNGEGTLPGYRIACTIQTDYSLLSQGQPEITRDQITPDDMEFFMSDSHLSLQDHILSLTEVMPLGEYIGLLLELDGAIGREIDGLIKR